MKKIFVIAMLLALVAVLTGCSGNKEETRAAETAPSPVVWLHEDVITEDIIVEEILTEEIITNEIDIVTWDNVQVHGWD